MRRDLACAAAGYDDAAAASLRPVLEIVSTPIFTTTGLGGSHDVARSSPWNTDNSAFVCVPPVPANATGGTNRLRRLQAPGDFYVSIMIAPSDAPTTQAVYLGILALVDSAACMSSMARFVRTANGAAGIPLAAIQPRVSDVLIFGVAAPTTSPSQSASNPPAPLTVTAGGLTAAQEGGAVGGAMGVLVGVLLIAVAYFIVERRADGARRRRAVAMKGRAMNQLSESDYIVVTPANTQPAAAMLAGTGVVGEEGAKPVVNTGLGAAWLPHRGSSSTLSSDGGSSTSSPSSGRLVDGGASGGGGDAVVNPLVQQLGRGGSLRGAAGLPMDASVGRAVLHPMPARVVSVKRNIG